MSASLENSCRTLTQLMKLAPDAITEIDSLLKKDLPGAVATRLNRIIAALYEISLLQDQIGKYSSRPPENHGTSGAGKGGTPGFTQPTPGSPWAAHLAGQANGAQNGAKPS